MPIRQSIQHVLGSYIDASRALFADSPLAQFIRDEFKDNIEAATGEQGRLVFKGSAGQSKWARGPWVAAFNPLVTASAQRGYYVCYLFREDMRGVYLSLNQGVTEAREHYKSDAKAALRARAQNYRAMLGNQFAYFSELEIDLAPAAPGNDTAYYEAGNICAVYYAADNVPPEQQLVDDLRAIVRIYDLLVLVETDSDSSLDGDDDEPAGLQYEDATRFRMHKRIERNAALVRRVKSLKGHTCQVCGTNFETRYGTIGTGYIEAHHLKPLATLGGSRVAMDPEVDFAVLCANCHRMVHRSGLVSDLARFKKEYFNG